MKITLSFIVLSLLLIISCKKKNVEPITPKANYFLKHSGIVDSSTFNLDTTSISAQLINMHQWDDYLFKVFEIQTWLTGPNLTTTINAGEERLTLDFSFILQYNVSEFDSNCDCLPTPSAARLADFINNSPYQWNDGDERKEVIIVAHNDQFGDGSYQVMNPQISAEAVGNALHIYGTIDSLQVGSFSPNRFLTNLHFDYMAPINP